MSPLGGQNLKIRILLFALAMTTVALAACQPAPFDATTYNTMDPYGTGLLNKDRIPYTIGGDTRIHKHAQQVGPKPGQVVTPQQQVQFDFAKSVVKVQMIRYDEQGKPARFGRARIAWFFHVKDEMEQLQKIEFEWTNTAKANVTISHLQSKNNSEYFLSGAMSDSEKQDLVSGVFDFNREGKDGKRYSVRIFMRSYVADAEWVAFDGDPWDNQKLKARLEALQQDTYAWVTNWGPVLGIATLDVQVLKFKNPGVLQEHFRVADLPAEKRSDDLANLQFQFTGEALRTSNQLDGHNMELATSAENSEAPAAIHLRGDREKTDERTFEVVLKDEGTKTTDGKAQEARVLLKIRGPQVTQVKEQPSIPIETKPVGTQGQVPVLQDYNSGNSLFHFKYKDSKYPQTTQFVDDLAQNYRLERIQDILKYWKGATQTRPDPDVRYPNEIKRFFSNVTRFKELISSIFMAYDVVPNIVSMWSIESNFVLSAQYKSIPVPPSYLESTAVGPGQFLWSTAKGLDMRVDKTQNGFGQKPKTMNDERIYLAPSLCGLPKHLLQDDKRFKHDFTWMIVAYRRGGGGTAEMTNAKIKKALENDEILRERVLKDAQGYHMTFVEMAEQNMVPDVDLSYATRALSAYFVSLDPQRTGVQLTDLNGPTPTDGYFLPPHPIQDDVCRAATAAVMK